MTHVEEMLKNPETPLETRWKYATAAEKWARRLVTKTLHYSNQSCPLNKNQQFEAYTLCDGFGNLSKEQHNEIGYDWSHVRDSTPEAILKCAAYILSC